MDILGSIALIFRLLSVVVGPLLAVVVYSIYRKTQGGSKGWLYLTIAFISLGVWSISQVVFLIMFPNFIARTITGAMAIFLITFFNPLGAVKLANDMQCKVPMWLTEFNIIMIGLVYYASMYVYSLMMSRDILGAVASISIIGMTPMFLIASLGYLCIAKTTRVRFWSLWVLGTIIVIIGSFMIVGGYASCCGTGAPLEWVPGSGCDGWIYDYAPVLPIPCIEAALPLISNSAIILSIGLLILLYSMIELRLKLGISR